MNPTHTGFAGLPLKPSTLDTLTQLGYLEMTAIQQEALPTSPIIRASSSTATWWNTRPQRNYSTIPAAGARKIIFSAASANGGRNTYSDSAGFSKNIEGLDG